jgi:uncharacterized protein (TIGR02453 family)
VKVPFSEFVAEMISRIQQYEPEIQIKPADAIMRINKDIRFSKDKTPYNTHVAANISVFGKKDKSYPGFYFQLAPAGVSIYGGVYMIENPALQEVRKYISENLSTFSALYRDNTFVEKYLSIQGEQAKRFPPEFKDAAIKEPMIANKQFYYSANLDSDLITSNALADTLMEYYLAGKPLNDFFRKGMKGV